MYMPKSGVADNDNEINSNKQAKHNRAKWTNRKEGNIDNNN